MTYRESARLAHSMLARSACQTEGVEHPSNHGRLRADYRRSRLQAARLYLVCGAQGDRFVEATLRGGVDIVQLRLKDADDEQIVVTGRRFARLCAAYDALFILNDRPDLVAEVAADGVHLGQDDTPLGQARALVGPERLIGLSTHTTGQINRAAQARGDRTELPDVSGDRTELPDYIGVGPVYATPTKPGREAVGLELVSCASRQATIPFFAIGGVDHDTVGDVVEAGAQRIAVVRALAQAADPEAAARRLRSALETERESVGAA